jgi:hypothetical protein
MLADVWLRPYDGLDSAKGRIDNDGMQTIPGRVKNGVVVLERGTLPEGAAVTVSYEGLSQIITPSGKKRIQVPLVRTGQPGTVKLTGERIAEILDQEDASPRR